MSIPALLDYVLEEVSLDGQEGNYIHLLYFAPRSSVGLCVMYSFWCKKYPLSKFWGMKGTFLYSSLKLEPQYPFRSPMLFHCRFVAQLTSFDSRHRHFFSVFSSFFLVKELSNETY